MREIVSKMQETINRLKKENKELTDDNETLSNAVRNQDYLIRKLKSEEVDEDYIQHLENMYDAILAIVYEVHNYKTDNPDAFVKFVGMIGALAVNSALGIPLEGFAGDRVNQGMEIVENLKEDLSEQIQSITDQGGDIKDIVVGVAFSDGTVH